MRLDSRARHIAKTVTWRVIASLTTFLLALFFFQDDPDATAKATWVATTEAFLKMALYYGHERMWYKIDFGISYKEKKD
jgi:uncharacterized membrane protein